MTKDISSLFPGAIRDHSEAAQAEAAKVNAKIEDAFDKLNRKMSKRADKAKSKLYEARKPEKRAVLLRRFELYSDAASWTPPKTSRFEGVRGVMASAVDEVLRCAVSPVFSTWTSV